MRSMRDTIDTKATLPVSIGCLFVECVLGCVYAMDQVSPWAAEKKKTSWEFFPSSLYSRTFLFYDYLCFRT